MPSAQHITDLLQSQNFDDFVRPNFFEVEFQRSGSSNDDTLDLTQDFIQKIGIPATTLGEIIIKRMGRKVVMPGEVAHGDNLLVGVHSDDKGLTRGFFQEWIADFSNNVIEGNFNDIRIFLGSSINVYSLTGGLKRRQKWVFRNAYPKFLGDLEFNHETDDQVMVFAVGFGFSILQYSNDFGSDFSDLNIQVDTDASQELADSTRDRFLDFVRGL